jgi:hypothetical protein
MGFSCASTLRNLVVGAHGWCRTVYTATVGYLLKIATILHFEWVVVKMHLPGVVFRGMILVHGHLYFDSFYGFTTIRMSIIFITSSLCTPSYFFSKLTS